MAESWSAEGQVGVAARVAAEVAANHCEGGMSWRLVLRVPGWSGFAPGQFAMISAGALLGTERSDPLLPRPMAVYRARATNGSAEVEILYKIVGRGTALLAEALAGQRVGFTGPLGRAFPPPAAGERVVIAAGGTGIASVYELAARVAPTHRLEVLLGARSADDLMAREDFEALGATLRVATEDGSAGTRGLVTALLESALDGPRPCRVYTCGPTPMMRRCAQIAAERETPCIAALENRMACGFGVCLGCAAPLTRGGFALVCRDGPAFDATAIDWEGLP